MSLADDAHRRLMDMVKDMPESERQYWFYKAIESLEQKGLIEWDRDADILTVTEKGAKEVNQFLKLRKVQSKE